MRGGFGNLAESAFEENGYINTITWFGCAPNGGVAANSSISVNFFKELLRKADPATGKVKLPHDMLMWTPGKDGNILAQVK